MLFYHLSYKRKGFRDDEERQIPVKYSHDSATQRYLRPLSLCITCIYFWECDFLRLLLYERKRYSLYFFFFLMCVNDHVTVYAPIKS